MPLIGQPSRYLALQRYLEAAPGDVVTLTFGEIKVLIEAVLPPSVYTRTWWTNTRERAHVRAWLEAGWRVGQVEVNVRRRVATFTRLGVG
jgi:hypothetical protein